MLVTRVRPIATLDQTSDGLDAVTGLSARARFMADLAQHHPDPDQAAVLCLIDIDQFRFLNAVAGTVAADQALREIAERLLAALAAGDRIGRTGDDEFALLIAAPDLAIARAKAASLLEVVRAYRLTSGDQVFTLTACAGLTQIKAGDAVESRLQLAMAACGAAKEAGRGSLVLASEQDCLSSHYHTEARILTGLQAAIADNRLRLYAQEIFNLAATADDLLQFELLVHMVDLDGTEFPPSAIIPAAERNGFIRDLDRWVVKSVLMDHAGLLHRHPNLSVSVNLSGQSLGDAELWPFVAALLDQSQVPARQIQFEITETSAIGNMAVALAFVEAARARGCKVALDDFGSGLSSFIYLRTFPVDCIKIDGAFVGNVTDPASVDRAIVTAIVGVARDLGITVVAEHVDSTDVLATLRQLGIDKVQGFLISQPQPFKEMFEKGSI